VRDSRTFCRLPIILALCGLLWTPQVLSQESSRLDRVLDAIVANERDLATTLEQYQPLVETYLQTVKPDTTLGAVPIKDSYFFGRLMLPQDQTAATTGKNGRKWKKKKKSLSLFDDFHSQTFKPESFAQMLLLDRGGFDRENYDLEFIRPEFLGEIRTLVFDVTPKPGKALNRLGSGRFTGRIWVEDQDYHIVRFNGIYTSVLTVKFHFDSWRLNMAPGLWLPAYVYTEEAERAIKQIRLTHRGQTRIWGYEIERPDAEDEFTKVLIDAPQTQDQSESPGQISPVESARAWEGEAEDNVIQRLERAGLLAPEGEVDQVLETVVANLEITNSLDIQPPVRCRVLLTTPPESFTVGHTIVLSRGLIDVLPDEASRVHRPGARRRQGSDGAVLVRTGSRRGAASGRPRGRASRELSVPRRSRECRTVPEGACRQGRGLARADPATLRQPDGQQERPVPHVEDRRRRAGARPGVGGTDRRTSVGRPRQARSLERTHRADEEQPRASDLGPREDAVSSHAADAVPGALRIAGSTGR
jgi:hypothetical protein